MGSSTLDSQTKKSMFLIVAGRYKGFKMDINFDTISLIEKANMKTCLSI